eukprot:1648897-Pyramimonas_sp.AAC.1
MGRKLWDADHNKVVEITPDIPRSSAVRTPCQHGCCANDPVCADPFFMQFLKILEVVVAPHAATPKHGYHPIFKFVKVGAAPDTVALKYLISLSSLKSPFRGEFCWAAGPPQDVEPPYT